MIQQGLELEQRAKEKSSLRDLTLNPVSCEKSSLAKRFLLRMASHPPTVRQEVALPQPEPMRKG